jgi:two-component system sensor histidine kinase SenX3
MQTPQLALLSLLVGVVLGGSVALVVVAAYRARDRALAESGHQVPSAVREVVAAMDDAAALIDASGTLVATSHPAAAFGLGRGVVLRGDELSALVRAARAGTATDAITMRLRRVARPAEPRLVSAKATAVSPRLVMLVIRDITEQERVEEMRRDFVANTSHELKTPVGAVSLLAEAIELAADDPDQVRAFSVRLKAEAARLVQLIGRIMDLSRLQASDALTDMRPVAIDAVVVAAVEANQIQADAAGVTLVRGGTRGLYVYGDSPVLSEAVSNLVANAIAASPTAGMSVGIGVKAADGVIEISVTDRGTGIAEIDQQRVFERFYRADHARSRRTGGTGLGLAIVKHAVQRHGGEVRLWSRLGQGSTFTIRLPEVAAPGGEKPKKSKKLKGASA